MSLFVAGAVIIGVTLLVLFNVGWLLGLAFMVWSLACYGTGMYEGAYIRHATRGGA